jgi:hypothetical protein
MLQTDPKLTLRATPAAGRTYRDTAHGEPPPDPSGLRSLPEFDIYLFDSRPLRASSTHSERRSCPT